jgi:hypothetical protein
MRTCYTLIFFTLIVLFSNSSLAYRIHQYPYEQYQVNIPLIKLMMAVRTEDVTTRPHNVLVPVNQISDGKLFI